MAFKTAKEVKDLCKTLGLEELDADAGDWRYIDRKADTLYSVSYLLDTDTVYFYESDNEGEVIGLLATVHPKDGGKVTVESEEVYTICSKFLTK